MQPIDRLLPKPIHIAATVVPLRREPAQDVLAAPPSAPLAAALATAADRLDTRQRGSAAYAVLVASDAVGQEAERRLAAIRAALAPASREAMAEWLLSLAAVIPSAPREDALLASVEALSGLLELPGCCFTRRSLRDMARACTTPRGTFWPAFGEIEAVLEPHCRALRVTLLHLVEVIACVGQRAVEAPGRDTLTLAGVRAQLAAYDALPADRWRAASVRVFRTRLEREAPALLAACASRLDALLEAPEPSPAPDTAPLPLRAAVPPNLAALRDASPIVQAARAKATDGTPD